MHNWIEHCSLVIFFSSREALPSCVRRSIRRHRESASFCGKSASYFLSYVPTRSEQGSLIFSPPPRHIHVFFLGNYSKAEEKKCVRVPKRADIIRTCWRARSPRSGTYVETTATAQQLCRNFSLAAVANLPSATMPGSKLASAIARLTACDSLRYASSRVFQLVIIVPLPSRGLSLLLQPASFDSKFWRNTLISQPRNKVDVPRATEVSFTLQTFPYRFRIELSST